MAFPLTVDAESPRTGDDVAPMRFSRRQSLRLRHNPHVDAAWWPRSSNLTAELVHLVQAAQESGFRATHVTYRLDDGWTTPPDHFRFDTRNVKASGYHNHHRDMVTLVDGVSHERLQVLVIPPETPPLLARRALRIAVVHADPIQGTDLLALAVDATSVGTE